MQANRRRPFGRPGVLVTLILLLCAGRSLDPAAPRAIGNDGADGRFTRRESFHFLLFQDVDIDESSGLYGSRQFEQDMLRELEAAYDRLSRTLELRPARKLAVTIWDPALFDARFAGLFRFPAAGFYGGSIHVRGGTRVTPALVRVLHHELVHAALDAEAPGVVLPAWLNEGLAEWFEARSVGRPSLSPGEQAWLAAVGQSGQLPRLADLSAPSFAGFDPEAASIAYLESYAFVQHLGSLAGDRGLVALWSAVLRSGSVERGVRRAFRRDLETLEQAFRRGFGAD
ncbi:MAG: hypothetical protein R3F35_22575 [Myxococcota bacterium]